MKQRANLKLDDDSTLDGKMEKLAESIADDLISGGEPKRARTDAFAKLTTYFCATRKLSGGEGATPDEPTRGFNFGAAKAKFSKHAKDPVQ